LLVAESEKFRGEYSVACCGDSEILGNFFIHFRASELFFFFAFLSFLFRFSPFFCFSFSEYKTPSFPEGKFLIKKNKK